MREARSEIGLGGKREEELLQEGDEQ